MEGKEILVLTTGKVRRYWSLQQDTGPYNREGKRYLTTWKVRRY
jgi:hypothetical protein